MQRKLIVLYPIFAQDDIYIVSNVTPHYLMSGETEGAYGVIDLSKANTEIRDDIRRLVQYLIPDRTVALRMDYLTRLIEKYNKVGSPPSPIGCVNASGEDIQVFLSNDDVSLSHDRIRELIKDPEIKDPKKKNILKLAWDIDEGFFFTPLTILRDLYTNMSNSDRVDVSIFSREDSKERQTEITVKGKQYRINPIVGVDTLNLSKFTTVRIDCFTAYSHSDRAIVVGHYAQVGEPGDLISLFIFRPDAILFPKQS